MKEAMNVHFDIDTAAVAGPSPFGLMVSPEVILQRIERSEQLASLRKRVLRPLDAPWIMRTAGKRSAAMDAADAAIECEFGALN